MVTLWRCDLHAGGQQPRVRSYRFEANATAAIEHQAHGIEGRISPGRPNLKCATLAPTPHPGTECCRALSHAVARCRGRHGTLVRGRAAPNRRSFALVLPLVSAESMPVRLDSLPKPRRLTNRLL